MAGFTKKAKDVDKDNGGVAEGEVGEVGGVWEG